MKRYPFKFLDAYTREDRGVFFGRDEEIASLYEMVFQSSVVLLYGGSGTGKTSLINCGLAGKFEPHDWMPLMVRRGSNINDALEKALHSAGGKVKNDYVDMAQIDEWETDNDKEVKALSPIGKSIRAIYQHSFRPIYLIFDQFEELFILGTPTEQKEFIKNVLDILSSGQPVKLIFSMREEYLGYLYEFERDIPQLIRKKLRIEPMNLEKVKQVIIGAAKFENSNIKIKKGEEDLVAEGIFEKIKGNKKSLTIQLPFLQVFLDKFYLEITGDKSRSKEAEFNIEALKKMGEIGDILINFMEEQVMVITKELGSKNKNITQETIWKVLSPFSTLEGTKEPISKKELYERLPKLNSKIVDSVVEAFIHSRMLRYNESTDTYELSHDALAKPIAEKRSVEDNTLLEIKRLIHNQVSINQEAREYFTEKQLLFIEPYANKIVLRKEELEWISNSKDYVEEQKKLKLKEQKRKRRVKIIWISVASVLILSTVVYITVDKIRTLKEKEYAEQLNKQNSQKLLGLITFGSERYAILKDSTLSSEKKDSIIKDIIRIETTYPIDSLIEPKVSRDPTAENYNFLLWIDVPSFRREEIREVHYHFCKDFIDKLRISSEKNTSFAIGYLGWGYCPRMKIDVILETKDTIRMNFDVENYLKKHDQL